MLVIASIERGGPKRPSVLPRTTLAKQGAVQASSRPSLQLVDPQQRGFKKKNKKENPTNHGIPGGGQDPALSCIPQEMAVQGLVPDSPEIPRGLLLLGDSYRGRGGVGTSGRKDGERRAIVKSLARPF